MHESLLSVDAARALILQSITPVNAEILPFDQAGGRVLARDVFSPLALPPFANSAMDGFAVIAADLVDAAPEHPVDLEVVAEEAAGHVTSFTLQPGQAASISTGAPLPAGADAVLPVEWVKVEGRTNAKASTYRVRVTTAVNAGHHVRPAGQALAEGELVLPAGHRLKPPDIGMLASIGHTQVEVHRRVRVALFSSGDELVEPGEVLTAGKIYDSNRYALAAAVQAMGAEARRLPIAADSRQEIRTRLKAACEWKPDLILSSAGVSVGEHDHVRPVVQEAGDLSFWRVNIRPGKPIAFGHYRGIPFLGLPGNPVSMLVTFELFVRPALAALMGSKEALYTVVDVRLREEVHSDGRESYLRGVVFHVENRLEAVLTGSQDSGILSSLVKANALLQIPAGVEQLAAGEQVRAYLLAPPIESIQEP
jgi:molybdopterin molybdotransferase